MIGTDIETSLNILKIFFSLIISSGVITLILLIIEKINFGDRIIDLVANPFEANYFATTVSLIWTAFWMVMTILMAITMLIFSFL
jgi:hypothetical protein